MRIPSSVHEIIDALLMEFKEGKNKDYLLGYIKAIEYLDVPEVEQYVILQDFVEMLFSYEPQK